MTVCDRHFLLARPKGQPFGCPFCSTTVACGLFCLSLTRRAKKLPPEVFLYALSNPFGCNFVPIKRRDSIRAPAGAWSLAVTTLHRSVALYRSSFKSLLKRKTRQASDETCRVLVGMKGFEPPIPCSQSRCDSQTSLHPEILRRLCGAAFIFYDISGIKSIKI